MPSELLELTNLGLEFFVARLCFKLAIISPDFFLVLFHLYVEVFNDFLFVVEAIVETSDRGKVFVKTFSQLFPAAWVFSLQLAENLIVVFVKIANLFTKFRQGAHVTFPAFDFFVLDDAVKALFASRQPVCKVEVAGGDKTKFVKFCIGCDFSILNTL